MRGWRQGTVMSDGARWSSGPTLQAGAPPVHYRTDSCGHKGAACDSFLVADVLACLCKGCARARHSRLQAAHAFELGTLRGRQSSQQPGDECDTQDMHVGKALQVKLCTGAARTE